MPTLQTSYDNVVVVRELLAQYPGAVCCTVASGTLNDVVKLASGELARPYLVVCTAASVDGYTAFGASIAKEGFKITRPCPAPAALIADTVVMASAPQRLTATGYGDLIEKLPAGADWILADEIGVEAITPEIWDLVQPRAREALAAPDLVAAGELEAVASLAEANLLSGLGMQAMRSSRPASGAGHLFSHVWEMEGHGIDWEPPLSHGFKVGIGTIASCALWSEALQLDLAGTDIDRLVANAPGPAEIEARCRALLIPRVVDAAVEQSLAKLATGDALRDRLRTIQLRWPQIRSRCAEQLITPQEVVDRLRSAGAPHHPVQIGIDLARLRRTHFQAQLIRSRYTVLDLLAELGVFEQAVDRLFGPDGFWSRQPAPDA
jgi:glycerol-1-phosphate dehydrogenase [NAD(P)+]